MKRRVYYKIWRKIAKKIEMGEPLTKKEMQFVKRDKYLPLLLKWNKEKQEKYNNISLMENFYDNFSKFIVAFGKASEDIRKFWEQIANWRKK